MHKHHFPSCPVDGPIEPPSQFSHFVLKGAVPRKCAGCQYLFEGSCRRQMELTGRYLRLDHGPCGIAGDTDPVFLENEFFSSKVEVPRKCSKCHHLSFSLVSGFECRKDPEKWGDFRRGLDWGSWRPDRIHVSLPFPKVTTSRLVDAAHRADLLAFVEEPRRVNPGTPVSEAREDFSKLREAITLLGAKLEAE